MLWAYGPANFFWLCNAAQFLLLWSLWREDRLMLASQAGVVVLIGAIWTADLLLGLALGGRSLTGITDYMFDPDFPLMARIVSLFHAGLPVFVLWLCLRLGYDRRGWWVQCGVAAVLLIGGYLPTDPVRNVNCAVAPFHMEQVWVPHWLYLLMLAAVVQPLILLIGHGLVSGLLGLFLGKGAEVRG